MFGCGGKVCRLNDETHHLPTLLNYFSRNAARAQWAWLGNDIEHARCCNFTAQWPLEKSLRHTMGIALHQPLQQLTNLAKQNDLPQANALVSYLVGAD